jgi:hypothetical protein
MMREATKRSIARWMHLAMGIPIVGYIYSPFDQIPNYAPAVRFVFLPVMLLSGLWMWKGHVVRGLIWKKAADSGRDAAGREREFTFAKQGPRS